MATVLHSQQFSSWVVFFFSAGAYVPLAVGGWQHPEEVNVVSYSLWLILSAILLYSAHSQGFAGWRMPLGFVFGNGSMLFLAFARGEYTFNLGPAESIVLYGIITTIGIWGVVGQTTGRWNPRILFLGSIVADILSFYPQLKQYLGPHDDPTYWMILGWSMWIAGMFVNVIFVERLIQKILQKSQHPLLALEESAFSLENGLLMIVTVLIMTRPI